MTSGLHPVWWDWKVSPKAGRAVLMFLMGCPTRAAKLARIIPKTANVTRLTDKTIRAHPVLLVWVSPVTSSERALAPHRTDRQPSLHGKGTSYSDGNLRKAGGPEGGLEWASSSLGDIWGRVISVSSSPRARTRLQTTVTTTTKLF